MRKPPSTAAQRGIGAGIGNTYTRNLGVSTARAPPKAKIAPEAPITMAKGEPRSIKNTLPSIPPQKYMMRKARVPTSLLKKLPKK
jgi:hypothetical protein